MAVAEDCCTLQISSWPIQPPIHWVPQGVSLWVASVTIENKRSELIGNRTGETNFSNFQLNCRKSCLAFLHSGMNDDDDDYMI
jgi:hypothetical protein